jgi:hypothetical protein
MMKTEKKSKPTEVPRKQRTTAKKSASKQSGKAQARATPAPTSAKQITDNDVLAQFFVRYGYLGRDVKITAEALQLGLRRYQAFHGLPVTGEPDPKTLTLIRSPRCGIPEFEEDFAPFEKAQTKAKRKTRALSAAARATLPPVRPLRCRWPTRRTKLKYVLNAASSGLNVNDVKTACKDAFQAWSSALDGRIVFEPALPGEQPDIALSWVTNDSDGWMGGLDVAHSDFPRARRPNGFRCELINIYPKPVHFDKGEAWVVRVPPQSGFYDVQTIALHEIGHILGMSHTGEAGSIMSDHIAHGFQQLQPSNNDIDSMRAGYGLPLRFPHQP